MRVQLRIVAGSLRGRKIACQVNAKLGIRPTPDRVREALFNILADSVMDRPFIDVFAGSGVVGLEAISRGAQPVFFIERDLRQVQEIHNYLEEWRVVELARLTRADAYRWARAWEAPGEPVTVFVSPPFADFQRRTDELLELLDAFASSAASGSRIILQAERHSELDGHPALSAWEARAYGRNLLLLHTCGGGPLTEPPGCAEP
ncbi:MAG: 16S rRNA (guanine(966)-N(2))-methyltransferase RsmD [Planctomycetes bacterium]|nr:16S rRNA (guanine(966)-N(2))-methyltransferase RsmD [Planctomycetota bacterium]